MSFTVLTGSLALFSLILPTSAYMQTPEDISETIKAWEAMEAEQNAEITQTAFEWEFQSDAALFPDVTEAAQGSRLEQLRDSRIAEFISVEIDGALTVFSDVPRNAWFAPYVREIAERRIVSGYRTSDGRPTGLFGPGDAITLEQMAKVMLYASGTATDVCSTHAPLNLTSSGSWSAPFIACAESLQWAAYGDGSIDVHRPTTRAEVMMTLLQAFKKEIKPSEDNGFADVSLTIQYGAAIMQAKQDGIISGYTDANGVPTGLFGPDDPVTRAEFAKIVTLGLQTYEASSQ